MKPMLCGAALYNPCGTSIEVASAKGLNIANSPITYCKKTGYI